MLERWLVTSYPIFPTHICSPHYLPFAVGLFDADRIYGGQFVTVLAKGLDPAIDIALRVPCQLRLVGHCKNTCVNNINFLARSYKLLNKEKYENANTNSAAMLCGLLNLLAFCFYGIYVMCIFWFKPKVLDLSW